MILGTAEQAGVQLVTLQTPGDTFYELVVEPAADCVGQRSIARRNMIAGVTDVCGAQQSVGERAEFSDRDRDLRSEHECIAPDIKLESAAGRQDKAADRQVVRTIVPT